MNPKLKIVIPAVILVVTLVVIFSFYRAKLTSAPVAKVSAPSVTKNQPKENSAAKNQEETLPPASSNPDAAVSAFEKEATDEQTQIGQNDQSAADVTSDIQDVNNLDQAGNQSGI